MKRRLLCLLLTLVMAVGLMTIAAAAEEEPGLWANYMLWASDGSGKRSTNGRPPFKVEGINANYSYPHRFYYGTSEDMELVVKIEETTSEKVFNMISEPLTDSDDGKEYFNIAMGGSFKTARLKLTLESGTTVENVPVVCNLPAFAFFSAPERTPENWLDSRVTYRPGTETTAYFLWEDGFSSQVTVDESTLPAGISAEAVQLEDNSYGIQFRISEEMKLDVQCTITYADPGNEIGATFWSVFFDDETTTESMSALYLMEYDSETGKFIGEPITKQLIGGYMAERTFGVFAFGKQLTNYTCNINAGGPAEIHVDSESGLLTIKSQTVYTLNLAVRANGNSIFISQNRGLKKTQDVVIGGETYTIIFGMRSDDDLVDGPGSYGAPIKFEDPDKIAPNVHRVGVAAYKNFGTDNQELATGIITDVTFGTANDFNGIMLIDSAKKEEEYDIWVGTMRTKCIVGDAHMTADVTLKNGQSIQLNQYCSVRIDQTQIIDCEAEGIFDVATLNKRIAALEIAGMYNMEDVVVKLAPGHVYEGTVVISSGGDWTLTGQEDDTGRMSTIIGGIEIEEDFNCIENICFIAPNTDKETIGVKHISGECYWISYCAFFGYDVAVQLNENGFSLPTQSNLFVNNETAIEMACGEKVNGASNNFIANSVFISNKHAVRIDSLPQYITRFEFRVRFCDFLNTQTQDIHVPASPHYYYFHRNYFGQSDKDGGYVAKRSAYKDKNAYTEYVSSGPYVANWQEGRVWWQELLYDAGLIERPGAIYLASEEAPHASDSIVSYLAASGLKMQAGSTELILDNTATETVILNDEASDLTVEESVLTNADIDISVADKEDTIIGMWSFHGTRDEAAPVDLFSETEETPFNAGLTVEEADGAINVTVVDSTVLQSLIPTLTVNCGDVDWNAAKVTFNGKALDSVVWDKDTNCVTFPVAAGGTYKIEQMLVFSVDEHDAGTHTITMEIPENLTGTLMIASYGENDQFLGVEFKNLDEPLTYLADARSVKIFLVDDIKTMIPQTESVPYPVQ